VDKQPPTTALKTQIQARHREAMPYDDQNAPERPQKPADGRHRTAAHRRARHRGAVPKVRRRDPASPSKPPLRRSHQRLVAHFEEPLRVSPKRAPHRWKRRHWCPTGADGGVGGREPVRFAIPKRIARRRQVASHLPPTRSRALGPPPHHRVLPSPSVHCKGTGLGAPPLPPKKGPEPAPLPQLAATARDQTAP